MSGVGGPIWSPNGNDILFTVEQDVTGQTIMQVSLDSAGQPRPLLTGITGQLFPPENLLTYVLAKEDGTSQACYAKFIDRTLENTAEKPLCLPAMSATEYRSPRISPDGHYLAFVANGTGAANVYVAQFPDGKGRAQVSTNEGDSPLWSQHGDELFYIADDKLMSVNVKTQSSLSLGAPVMLFPLAEKRFLSAPSMPLSGGAFDISRDGRSFLMVQRVGEEPRATMVVDQNWLAAFQKNKGN
jgi:hypothetical protein